MTFAEIRASITCRRRHVKCDELRPHCHRCIKGGQTCIYADKKPDQSGQTEHMAPVAISDQSQTPKLQPIPPWESSPQQTLRYSQTILEKCSSRSAETPTFQTHPSTASTNGFVVGNQTNLPPGPATQPAMSPEMSYAGTAFSLGNNDTGSLVARSVSSQPTYVAITRWFDMLVGDSAFENGFADFDVDMDEPNNFDTPREQDRVGVPYMGPYNSTPNTTGPEAPSPSSSSPQLLERSAPGPDRDAIAEKTKWQTPASIELLPYEHLIFRNFVQNISHWVRCSIVEHQ